MNAQTSIRLASRGLRILIAEDHPVVRKLVRFTLEATAHFHICDEATDGAQAVEKAKELKPDVVILNVTMPILNGFEAAREIKKHVPEAAIVILSSDADRHFLEIARTIGVRAYVSKSKVGEALVKAVEAAVAGEDFFVLN